MRKVCEIIKQRFPSDEDCSVYCYMDDLTLICSPELVEEVVNVAIQAAEQCGFTVNKDKSSVLCNEFIPISHPSNQLQIPFAKCNESLRLLGVNITDNFEEFNNNVLERIDGFFDGLDNVDVHPEIKHMILYYCGRPRLQYYCETTPPQFGREVVNYFQHRMKTSFGKIIGVNNIEEIRDCVYTNCHGGNLPNYALHYDNIYSQTAAFVEMRSNEKNTAGPLRVELIDTSIESFTSLECAHDRLWTHYMSPSNVQHLTPKQYSTALCVRCKLIPDFFKNEVGNDYIQCWCDERQLMCVKNLTEEEEAEMKEIGQQVPLIQHIIKCPAMHQIFDRDRHDRVKDAVRCMLSRYGFSVYNEPTFYDYKDGLHNRPDITVCIPTQRPYLTTDFTIVQPDEAKQGSHQIGVAALRAANAKIQKHTAAVHQRDHQFIPFALETTGHFDNGAKEFIRILKDTLPFSSRINFLHDMYGAVSTALAGYRADLISVSLTRAKTRRD